MNEQTPIVLSILTLGAFIDLWLCKTRIEIENLCRDNEPLKNEMLKSQLSEPLEAWAKIKERAQIKVDNIEDCFILGYSWGQIKQIVEYAKRTNFQPS